MIATLQFGPFHNAQAHPPEGPTLTTGAQLTQTLTKPAFGTAFPDLTDEAQPATQTLGALATTNPKQAPRSPSPAEDFPKTAIVLPDGKEADVIVRVAERELQLVCDDGKCGQKGQVLKSLPYAGIKSAEYSFSIAPRHKTLFFLKEKKHWLAIAGKGESAVLRLDKKNYKAIIAALESNARIMVETVVDESDVSKAVPVLSAM